MAYKFGQFRKEQYTYSNYVKQLDKNEYLLTSIQTESLESGIIFNDISIRRNFSTVDGSIFIRFAITKRFSRDTNMTIKLARENASALDTINTQTIANITIPKGESSEEMSTPVIFDIVVSPSDNYSQLIFAIDRDQYDYTETSRELIPTHTFILESFGTISNIISTLDIENTGRLKQIGIQSRPGLEMCINGEMIRVGRSGIYELNHGIDITFIGFMPEEDDHFLMDYQY